MPSEPVDLQHNLETTLWKFKETQNDEERACAHNITCRPVGRNGTRRSGHGVAHLTINMIPTPVADVHIIMNSMYISIIKQLCLLSI